MAMAKKSKYKIRKKYKKQTKVYHDFGLVRLYNCSDLTLKLFKFCCSVSCKRVFEISRKMCKRLTSQHGHVPI